MVVLAFILNLLVRLVVFAVRLVVVTVVVAVGLLLVGCVVMSRRVDRRRVA